MDSRMAADPVARHILEVLATLEKAAGVRAHYRILDPPPLTSTDRSSVQTVARVLGDWIGLRNAMFEVTILEHDQPPRMVRVDPDREDFIMEVPAAALATPDTTLAIVTRQVARTYLMNSNIGGSSGDPGRTAGSLADVTAIFLGMGKLVLNAPAAGQISMPPGQNEEGRPLSPEYLAFTHRLVCSMRGLDWNQHTSGMSTQALNLLRAWDSYRDTVFSHALRNVLTASASHRPLMDAVEDNHLALARFDQLQRAYNATVVVPLEQEMEKYHQTCREGMERLSAREQDTYDPCLLYLNQLRRRMDLQRYADMLLVQQDHIINRLRILTGGLSDMNARKLVNTEQAAGFMEKVKCPFDNTPIPLHDDNQDARVKCPTCGYAFLATSGLPQVSALRQSPGSDGSNSSGDEAAVKKTGKADSKAVMSEKKSEIKKQTGVAGKKRNHAAAALIAGIILLPLSWLPMLGYVLIMIMQGKDSPLTPMLGKLGIWGSAAGLCLLVVGLIFITKNWIVRKRHSAIAGEG